MTKKYRCIFCGAILNSGIQLASHIGNFHPGQTARLKATLPRELVIQFKRSCWESGHSPSEVIRELILAWLDADAKGIGTRVIEVVNSEKFPHQLRSKPRLIRIRNLEQD